jgi:hypothetical protein
LRDELGKINETISTDSQARRGSMTTERQHGTVSIASLSATQHTDDIVGLVTTTSGTLQGPVIIKSEHKSWPCMSGRQSLRREANDTLMMGLMT